MGATALGELSYALSLVGGFTFLAFLGFNMAHIKRVSEGKKMMKEGQRERKRMRDTGTAFQFKNKKTWHPLKPGDKKTYKVDKKGIAQ